MGGALSSSCKSLCLSPVPKDGQPSSHPAGPFLLSTTDYFAAGPNPRLLSSSPSSSLLHLPESLVEHPAQGHGYVARSTAAVLLPGQLPQIRGRLFANARVACSKFEPACDMERPQHVGAIAELNLSTCQPSTLVNTLNSVPGLKTSAGQLNFVLFPESASTHTRHIQCLGFYSFLEFNKQTANIWSKNEQCGASRRNQISHCYIASAQLYQLGRSAKLTPRCQPS